MGHTFLAALVLSLSLMHGASGATSASSASPPPPPAVSVSSVTGAAAPLATKPLLAPPPPPPVRPELDVKAAPRAPVINDGKFIYGTVAWEHARWCRVLGGDGSHIGFVRYLNDLLERSLNEGNYLRSKKLCEHLINHICTGDPSIIRPTGPTPDELTGILRAALNIAKTMRVFIEQRENIVDILGSRIFYGELKNMFTTALSKEIQGTAEVGRPSPQTLQFFGLVLRIYMETRKNFINCAFFADFTNRFAELIPIPAEWVEGSPQRRALISAKRTLGRLAKTRVLKSPPGTYVPENIHKLLLEILTNDIKGNYDGGEIGTIAGDAIAGIPRASGTIAGVAIPDPAAPAFFDKKKEAAVAVTKVVLQHIRETVVKREIQEKYTKETLPNAAVIRASYNRSYDVLLGDLDRRDSYAGSFQNPDIFRQNEAWFEQLSRGVSLEQELTKAIHFVNKPFESGTYQQIPPNGPMITTNDVYDVINDAHFRYVYTTGDGWCYFYSLCQRDVPGQRYLPVDDIMKSLEELKKANDARLVQAKKIVAGILESRINYVALGQVGPTDVGGRILSIYSNLFRGAWGSPFILDYAPINNIKAAITADQIAPLLDQRITCQGKVYDMFTFIVGVEAGLFKFPMLLDARKPKDINEFNLSWQDAPRNNNLAGLFALMKGFNVVDFHSQQAVDINGIRIDKLQDIDKYTVDYALPTRFIHQSTNHFSELVLDLLLQAFTR